MRLGIVLLALGTIAAPVSTARAAGDETSAGLAAPRPRPVEPTVVVLPEAPRVAPGLDDEGLSALSDARARELRFVRGSLLYLAYTESNSVVDGLLHATMGGVWIGFGAGINGLEPAIRTYYYVQGGSMLARAGVAFAIRPNAKRAALEIDAMPSRTRAEAEARLAYGAEQLRLLARQHRTKRLLSSGLSIASGVIPLPFALNSGVAPLTSGWAIVALVSGGIDVITGIIGLAIRTEAERRYRAYEQMRVTRVESIEIGALPVFGGAGASFTLRYH